MTRKQVLDIDNSMNEKLMLLDPRMNNFFDVNFSLIMDFSSYVDRIVFGQPMRTLEHRLIYVSEGNASLSIGFDEYELVKGCLLLIPRGSVITVNQASRKYNPLSLAFSFPDAEDPQLISYTTISLKLSADEQTIVANYFSLINQLVKVSSTNLRGVNYLILSLLFHVYTLREEATRQLGVRRTTRGIAIRDAFLLLINRPQIPERSVSWYAKELGISEEYLRSTIKAQTMQTPMHWINMATIREARVLLVAPEHFLLSDIATMLHFAAASQFVKFFKRETGQTPTEFRKRFL